MEKKLYRSRQGRQLCGVCGGLAKFLSLDPTIVRVLWVLFAFCGAGVLAYLVCALIIPEEPDNVVDAN